MEVLLCCDDGDNNSSIDFYNPLTGSKIMSLRGPVPAPHSLSILKNEGFLIVEKEKPFVHFWTSGSLNSSSRILLNSKVNACTVSPDCSLIALSLDTQIIIYEPASNRTISIISSTHYRPINVIKFNAQGTHLLSGGQDAVLCVFRKLSLFSSPVTPLYKITHHSLPITDIWTGVGASRSTFISVSLDKTAKMYSMLNGSLLLSINFPTPLSCVMGSYCESKFFVGSSSKGSIYEVLLSPPPKQDSDGSSICYQKHQKPISALSLNSESNVLASGDEGGRVVLWDTMSRQVIKIIKEGAGEKVTELKFWIGNPHALSKKTIFFSPLPKILSSVSSEEVETEVVVWNRNENLVSKNYESDSSSGSGDEDEKIVEKLARLKKKLTRSRVINKKLRLQLNVKKSKKIYNQIDEDLNGEEEGEEGMEILEESDEEVEKMDSVITKTKKKKEKNKKIKDKSIGKSISAKKIKFKSKKTHPSTFKSSSSHKINGNKKRNRK